MHLLIVWAALLMAGVPERLESTVETAHLTATMSARRISVAPGERTSLVIEVAPKPGMHVYAPQQKSYIPVSLTLTTSASFRAHPPTFPRPEKYFFAPLKETQLVYTKPFKIGQDITLAPAAALGGEGGNPGTTVTINGTLRYQACDDTICYLPKNLPVSWTIRLKPAPSIL
jgi:DsbC/DsbD-like thiol-disulfide interchange protein